MKDDSLIVVLKMSRLSIPDKVKKARFIVESVAANSTVFVTPNPALATITTAIDTLDKAYDDTADGAVSKTAIMYDKEAEVMRLLGILADYVQEVAEGDVEIVHLAAMEVKKKPTNNAPEFEVYQLENKGSVGLRVKARKKTIYKWQYCKDPQTANQWLEGATSDVSKATITNLEAGVYWFKVVFMDGSGDHESNAIRFAVN